jgi:polypyrimidine tract-binding protein 1
MDEITDDAYSAVAAEHLNGCPLHGKNIITNISKHTSISLPKSGEGEPAKLTKDFTNSPLHRYRIQGSKNFQHISSPSPYLHISNIPVSINELDLASLFGRFGTVLSVSFFP